VVTRKGDSVQDLATMTTTRTNAVAVARVTGEVDTSNAEKLFAASVDLLAAGEDVLVIDLTACHYLDSAGIREVLMLNKALAERRQRLVLVLEVTGSVHRVLSIVGALDHVPWYRTLDDALAAHS
jgi:anti-sigma B factor antagonist